MGLFLLYIKIIVYVFLHSQTRCRCVHVNPHVHVVYADFCLYKMNPWKMILGIFYGSQPPKNFNLIEL